MIHLGIMDSKKEGWIYATILIVGFIIYLPTLFFNFTYFDDNELILNNLPFLKNLSNLPAAFARDVFHVSNFSAFYYRPLLTISLILDAQFSGANPFFYHLTNVLIHLASACLFYYFLRAMKYKKDLSLVSSLVFVAHPIFTQAVSWIPGRNDSLLTLFTLAAIISLTKFIDKKNLRYILFYLFFFALAVFTKESGIFISVISVIFIFLFAKAKFSLNDWSVLTLGWIGVLAPWYFARNLALGKEPYSLASAFQSIFVNSPGILLYLGKMMFPVNLSVLPILVDSTLIFGLVSLALIAFLLIISKQKDYRKILFGIVWFLIFLAPSLVRPDTEHAADFIEHRIYLSVVGLILVFLEIDIIKKLSFQNMASKILIGLIIFALSATTFLHSFKFKDRFTFWMSAVKTSPHHPLAHRNLGAMYFLDGRLEEAEKEFLKSLELNANEPMVHNNLGLVYMNRDLFDKAEKEYKDELEINPYYDNAYFNYGLLYYKKGMFNKAQEMWLNALKINPENKDAFNALIVLNSEKNLIK